MSKNRFGERLGKLVLALLSLQFAMCMTAPPHETLVPVGLDESSTDDYFGESWRTLLDSLDVHVSHIGAVEA